MTTISEKPSSIEERLQPWIDEAEILIALTLIIMAWAAGWVDLFAFESFNGDIFGRYSLPFFVALIAHTFGFVVWFRLMLSLNALRGFKRFIGTLQERAPRGLLMLGFFVLLLWSMPHISYWAMLPLYQGSMIVVMLIFTLLLFFLKPRPESRMQPWRRIVLGVLGAFLVVELVLYVLAFARVLPLENTSGLFEPYGLIYQNQEGSVLARSNQFGWYAPDFQIDADARTILLNGDTFVQGVQVPLDAHMAQQLQAGLTDSNTQVMSVGQAGYGPGVYLDNSLYGFIWGTLQPDEMIIFFHLANDFQVVDAPRSERVFFNLRESGRAVLDPADSVYQHALAHVVFSGHEAPVFIEGAMTYSFLLNELSKLIDTRIAPPPPAYDLTVPPYSFLREVVPFYPVTPYMDEASTEEPFGPASFVFASEPSDAAETAYGVAFSQIRNIRDYLAERDIRVRLVTIPYFPAAFYDSAAGPGWESSLGDYDMLQPEARLQAFAQEEGIAFIATGTAMQAEGLGAADIQALFFREGNGHLTESGHAFFAQMLADCFYANEASPSPAGCTR